LWKIKYVELILKNAWDLCCEYDICWWIDIEDMHENICEWVWEIFGLRIVMINRRWWIGCIYDYGIVDKNVCDWVVRIAMRSLYWYAWNGLGLNNMKFEWWFV